MAVAYTLEFEKPLQELDRQIDDLRKLSAERGLDVAGEVKLLETRLATLRKDLYKSLTPMHRGLGGGRWGRAGSARGVGRT